jgi:hypothetical protein
MAGASSGRGALAGTFQRLGQQRGNGELVVAKILGGHGLDFFGGDGAQQGQQALFGIQRKALHPVAAQASCAWFCTESRSYTVEAIHCVLTRASSASLMPSRATRASSARSASSTCWAVLPPAGTPVIKNSAGPRPVIMAELPALSATGCSPWVSARSSRAPS